MPKLTVTLEPELVERMDALIAASGDPSSLVTYGGRSAVIAEALRAYLDGRE
jgi:metal-responsive CopG/Arc/MetJ family transcriptional regulator